MFYSVILSQCYYKSSYFYRLSCVIINLRINIIKLKNIFTKIVLPFTRGQSYKNFYTLGKIYKCVLKPLDKFLFVIMSGYCYLTYLEDGIFIYFWIGNLGTLFYTALQCKKFYRIGPWFIGKGVRENYKNCYPPPTNYIILPPP